MINNKGLFYFPWHRGGIRPWLIGAGLLAILFLGSAASIVITEAWN